MDTGFTDQDVQTDFSRARRRSALSRLSARLRREPDDVNVILPFEEVVAALGWRGERRVGVEAIPLDSIVGSVDRTREFDRRFRPTSMPMAIRPLAMSGVTSVVKPVSCSEVVHGDAAIHDERRPVRPA